MRVEIFPGVEVYHGDCREVLPGLPENFADSVVTDPPYGLTGYNEVKVRTVLQEWLNGDSGFIPDGRGFMDREWDAFVPPPGLWRECLRVLRPGAHALVFAGTRSFDLMTISLRLAGFEIRDTLMWVYGSGFPKGISAGKAIDRMLGAERPVVRERWKSTHANGRTYEWSHGAETGYCPITAPATPEAAQWEGWSTSLKPAWEPIIICRKPLEGSVAENILKWGTGALNVDACRVPDEYDFYPHHGGRWPANLVHDGSHEVLALFPQDGNRGRFFYCAKATPEDRDEGLEGFPLISGAEITGRVPGSPGIEMWGGKQNPYAGKASSAYRNPHPTVKPTALMRWLVRLVTPPGGVVLDPFAGSGSTGKAAVLEGFGFIGIEVDEEYARIAEARIRWALERRGKKELCPMQMRLF